MQHEQFDFTTCRDRTAYGSSKWRYRSEAAKRAGYAPLSTADMEFAVAPCIERAVVDAATGLGYGYTEPDEAYLGAVCDWQRDRHGWDVQPGWVVLTPGVCTALKLAIRTFTEPGDKVIIQPPVYYPFAGGTKQTGREVVENPLVVDADGRWRMDFEDLAQKAADPRAKVLLLCNPHNPVGRVWERGELEELSRICLDNGVLVVSDEIHGDLVVGDTPLTCYATLSDAARDNSIICTATSKTFNLAGLSNANTLIADEGIRSRFAERASLECPWGVPYFSRAATIAAYREGGPWLDALLDIVRENNRVLVQVLGGGLPQLRFSALEGTYLPWVDFRGLGLSAKELSALVRDEALVEVDEGWLFGEQGAGFMRFNVAAPTDVVRSAAERIVAAARARGL